MIAAVLLSMTIVGQNPPLRFEVASVKPSKPIPMNGQRGANAIKGAGLFLVEGHRFVALNDTLYKLIKWSYGITDSRCMFSECDLLTGGPGWVTSDQFDIEALMPEGSPIYDDG